MATPFSQCLPSSPTFLTSRKPFFQPFSSQTKKPVPRYSKYLTITSVLSPTAEISSSPALQNFWQWACQNGVLSNKSPSIKPGLVPEGLGLIAQKNMSRNEVVIEVPKKYWINSDTVAATDIGKFCSGLKPWMSIALFLLREKSREDSPWRSYLDILPKTTDSPIFWSEEELSVLQGTQLLSTTLGMKNYVQRAFLKIEEEIILPNRSLFPSITFDDFLWAFGMLRSRAFSRLRGQNLVLIPIADLINHSPSITTEDLAYEIKGGGLFSREVLFSLRTPISVKAGDQILIQYDLGKSNAELALDYGLTETKSQRNIYTITLQISESDPFYGDKLDVAESNGLGEIASFDFILGESLPATMLPYLRLLALGGTDAFLLESIFRNAIWDHLQLPLSRANEELVCQVVRDTCKTALSGYATSIDEDEKLLAAGNLDPRLELAVVIRVGEKKVLEQIDAIFKDRALELDELEYYQERRLKDLGLVGEQGDIIFWEPK